MLQKTVEWAVVLVGVGTTCIRPLLQEESLKISKKAKGRDGGASR